MICPWFVVADPAETVAQLTAVASWCAYLMAYAGPTLLALCFTLWVIVAIALIVLRDVCCRRVRGTE